MLVIVKGTANQIYEWPTKSTLAYERIMNDNAMLHASLSTKTREMQDSLSSCSVSFVPWWCMVSAMSGPRHPVLAVRLLLSLTNSVSTAFLLRGSTSLFGFDQGSGRRPVKKAQ